MTKIFEKTFTEEQTAQSSISKEAFLKRYRTPCFKIGKDKLYNKKDTESYWEDLSTYQNDIETKVIDLINQGFSRFEVGIIVGRSEREIFRVIKRVREVK